jgi:signal transduction histidine kinase
VEAEARLLVHETELVAFAGMVAHDLGAPLRAIGGFTRTLATQLEHAPGGVDAACTASMGKILAAVTRMGGLIEALLAYATARDRPLRQEPLDLQTLVNQVIAGYTDERDAIGSSAPEPTIDIDIDDLPYVNADPIMCRQVLDNLIGNALKYRPQDQPAHIYIRASAEAEDMVRVEIADHGIGIPADQHPKIFTPFHRAHAGYPGNGLGLAICQRVIERHGGTIGVSDTPGGGSTFHFTFASIDRSG